MPLTGNIQIGPAVLECQFDDEALFEALFANFKRQMPSKPEEQTPKFVCTLTTLQKSRFPACSPDEVVIFDGVEANGFTCRITFNKGCFQLTLRDMVLMRWYQSAACMEVKVAPNIPAEDIEKLYPLCTALIMQVALENTDQLLVHGAALVLREKGILLCGPSGRGKTTTSIALALNGLKILTDDSAVVYQSEAGKNLIWGLPRPLKVHKKTTELLPKLKLVTHQNWDINEEQLLTLECLDSLSENPARPKGDAVPLAAIVLLQSAREDDIQLAPLSSTRALLELTADNILYMNNGINQTGVSRFAQLAALVQNTPTYSLSVKRGVRENEWTGLWGSLLSVI